MRRLALGTLCVLLLASCGVGLQDRHIPDLHLKSATLESAAYTLFRREQIPYGIVVIQPDPAPVYLDVNLTGRRLGEILDLLVEGDPRYAWSIRNGVAEIYPRGSLSDATSIWNLRIGDQQRELEPLGGVLLSISTDPVVKGTLSFGGSSMGNLPVRIRLRRPRLRHALDAIVKSAGGCYWRGWGSGHLDVLPLRREPLAPIPAPPVPPSTPTAPEGESARKK